MPETRPNWDEYFLAIAEVVSTRSIDPSTKHGCVLVKDRHIIGTGYNGPPRGMLDKNIPLTRPEKYPWMKHAEHNALLNRTLLDKGFTAYITGEPCFHCLTDLYTAGCTTIVHGSRGSACIDEEQLSLKEFFYDNCVGRIVFYENEKFTKIGFTRRELLP